MRPAHCTTGVRTAVAVAIALSGSAAAAAEDCLYGAAVMSAVRIADPRTLILADGRTLHIAGIESFAPMLADGDVEAEAALQRRLQAIVQGNELQVRLLSEAPDRYGRLPALLATDRRLIQERLAADGLAIAYPGSGALPCFTRILAAEDEARRTRRGYWSGLRLTAARPQALAPLTGRFAIFEGAVISVGNRRARTYLNFGSFWAEDVTVEIAGRDREAFGGEAGLAALQGKRVRVRGFVAEKGGPMIQVRSPDQLEILGETAGAEGKTP